MSQEHAGIGHVTVLAVAPAHDLAHLRRILGHTRWELLEAGTLAEAAAHLCELTNVVVISEAKLPDGTWRDLLRATTHLPHRPPVIVAAHHADDRLWMEVLNLGGYNVLAKPLLEQEVFRMISNAWLHRNDATHSGASASSSS